MEAKVNCPHCGGAIEDLSVLAKAMGAKGGAKSRRTITPEQQAQLQAARKAAKRREYDQSNT